MSVNPTTARTTLRVNAPMLPGTLPVLALAAVWVFSGAFKAMDAAAFEESLRGHGVLGSWAPHAALAVPVFELLVGAALVLLIPPAVGGRRTVAVVLSLSLGLLGAFSIYLLLVPSDRLVTFGCVCHGSLRLEQSFSDGLLSGRPSCSAKTPLWTRFTSSRSSASGAGVARRGAARWLETPACGRAGGVLTRGGARRFRRLSDARGGARAFVSPASLFGGAGVLSWGCREAPA